MCLLRPSVNGGSAEPLDTGRTAKWVKLGQEVCVRGTVSSHVWEVSMEMINSQFQPMLRYQRVRTVYGKALTLWSESGNYEDDGGGVI